MTSDKRMRAMEEKRDRILQSAIQLFAENSYEQTTVAQVAKKAGVSFGTVFTYFENKEELYFQSVKEPLEQLVKKFLQFDTKTDDVLNEISRMIKDHLILFSQQKKYLQLIVKVNGTHEQFPEVFQLVYERTQELIRQISKLIENGQRRGELVEGESEYIATAYISLLFGLELSYIDELGEDLINTYTQIAKRLFGPK
ncbi:TetR/AcrR family transcriptional regulator [Viridibacillus arvi]|uniref:TetR/AcrR family transcriptional regulator n=1 Tax=Viridibacillus arvi TaxID=263475 RepID=UPI00187B6F9C|nr:TetR/AcrR family transcriptional regulator [Viridibacillus sp. JNUCC-6]QOV12208.1 TetR/AcrR family transcriptional regulator [Viridibacillus sp. JNUCC-6]